ncbi:hypothetical protein EW146_g5394 [Bondarzewia mesenterica]|uniref:Uncharacterized protein n=1 Tax=Bondarzewia mesenterica TaxID=1095465 RepID=A0A4S4LRN6_9AGAM|nr:hypothetical protein EW146_g5394 [Bondarzewia mesenterica]
MPPSKKLFEVRSVPKLEKKYKPRDSAVILSEDEDSGIAPSELSGWPLAPPGIVNGSDSEGALSIGALRAGSDVIVSF